MLKRIRYFLGIFTTAEREVLKKISDTCVEQSLQIIAPEPVKISGFSKVQKQALIGMKVTGYFDFRNHFVGIQPSTRFWKNIAQKRSILRHEHAIVV